MAFTSLENKKIFLCILVLMTQSVWSVSGRGLAKTGPKQPTKERAKSVEMNDVKPGFPKEELSPFAKGRPNSAGKKDEKTVVASTKKGKLYFPKDELKEGVAAVGAVDVAGKPFGPIEILHFNDAYDVTRTPQFMHS